MSKNLSAKYYQENKERLQYLSKEGKEKKATIWSWMLQKSLREWKNWLGIEKRIIEWV